MSCLTALVIALLPYGCFLGPFPVHLNDPYLSHSMSFLFFCSVLFLFLFPFLSSQKCPYILMTKSPMKTRESHPTTYSIPVNHLTPLLQPSENRPVSKKSLSLLPHSLKHTHQHAVSFLFAHHHAIPFPSAKRHSLSVSSVIDHHNFSISFSFSPTLN